MSDTDENTVSSVDDILETIKAGLQSKGIHSHYDECGCHEWILEMIEDFERGVA